MRDDIRAEARKLLRRPAIAALLAIAVALSLTFTYLIPYAGYAGGSLPEVERAAEEILSLPMFPGMTTAQVTRVCDLVVDAAERASELARVG